jgi:hypothetical protein
MKRSKISARPNGALVKVRTAKVSLRKGQSVQLRLQGNAKIMGKVV